MTPEQLKASILQYAIQGKLVEQRPEEGTAEEMYNQIQDEKAKLIKEGKIKKEKPLNDITDDEIPFDIPESWKWVRIGDLISVQNGYAYKPEETNKNAIGFPVIKSGNVMTLKVELKTRNDYVENPTEKMLKSKIVKGDMLMCLSSQSDNPEPLGKTAIYEWDTPALLNQRVLKIQSCISELTKYLYYTINSEYFHYTVSHQGGGSAQANLKMEHVLGMVIPLPPLEEQQRIVAKIEELLPFVDRYAASYEKLEQFNAKFPEDMKKSILQYAIQGKLVEQRPEEGTAEELYQQIQEEKQKYKIKELQITGSDEAPFDIPDAWKWIRLQDIVSKTIKRGKSPKYVDKSSIQVFAQKCNVKTGGINMNLALFLDESAIEKYPNEEFMCNGDIVINSTGGGTMGRVGIFHDTDRIDDMKIVPDGHVTVIRACEKVDYKYLYYFLKHNQNYLETQGEGSTNQTELKPITIASLWLPLPPLEEQHRIVAKIEELLPYCDQLIK